MVIMMMIIIMTTTMVMITIMMMVTMLIMMTIIMMIMMTTMKTMMMLMMLLLLLLLMIIMMMMMMMMTKMIMKGPRVFLHVSMATVFRDGRSKREIIIFISPESMTANAREHANTSCEFSHLRNRRGTDCREFATHHRVK